MAFTKRGGRRRRRKTKRRKLSKQSRRKQLRRTRDRRGGWEWLNPSTWGSSTPPASDRQRLEDMPTRTKSERETKYGAAYWQ